MGLEVVTQVIEEYAVVAVSIQVLPRFHYRIEQDSHCCAYKPFSAYVV